MFNTIFLSVHHYRCHSANTRNYAIKNLIKYYETWNQLSLLTFMPKIKNWNSPFLSEIRRRKFVAKGCIDLSGSLFFFSHPHWQKNAIIFTRHLVYRHDLCWQWMFVFVKCCRLKTWAKNTNTLNTRTEWKEDREEKKATTWNFTLCWNCFRARRKTMYNWFLYSLADRPERRISAKKNNER